MRNFLLALALTTPARCARRHTRCTRASASDRLDSIHLRYWKAEPSSNFSENGVLAGHLAGECGELLGIEVAQVR